MEYALVATVVWFLLAVSLQPAWSLAWDVVVFGFAIGILAYIFLNVSQFRRYGYDEKGVYRRGKLVFSWSQVRKTGLSFAGGGHSVTLAAWPTRGAIISGPFVERDTWVSYSVSLVFTLEDNKEVTIASGLDKLAGGILEKIDEVARAANPRIEFE